MLDKLNLLGNIVGIVQTHNTNKISKDALKESHNANKISKDALTDSQKDYMPFLEVVGEARCSEKTEKELFDGITFDFFQGIICNENGELCLDDSYEYVPLTLRFRNVGKELIHSIEIESIYICAESKAEYERKMTEGYDVYKMVDEPECQCKKELRLDKGEEQEVIFLFSNEQYWMSSEEFQGLVEGATILIEMDLKLFSLNHSSYFQKGLWCEVENGVVKKFGFENVVSTK